MDTRIEEYLQAKCRNRECTNLRGQSDKPRSLYCSSRCQSREQNLRQGRIKHARRRPTRTKLGVLPTQQKHRYSELAPEVLQAQALLNLNAAEAAAGSQTAVVATAVALARSRSTSPPATPWPSPTRGTYSSPATPEPLTRQLPMQAPLLSEHSHQLGPSHQHHHHHLQLHSQSQSQTQSQQHHHFQQHYQHHPSRPYAGSPYFHLEPQPLSFGPSPLLSLVSASLDEQQHLLQLQQQQQHSAPGSSSHSLGYSGALPQLPDAITHRPSPQHHHHHLYPQKQPSVFSAPHHDSRSYCPTPSSSSLPASFSSSSSVCSSASISQPQTAAKPATLLLPGSYPRTSTTFASSPPPRSGNSNSAVVLPAIVSYDAPF